MSVEIGPGLRKARVQFGDGRSMTLRELSERVSKRLGKSISHAALHAYETGAVQPKSFMVKAIAEVLGVTVDQLERLAQEHGQETAPVGRSRPATDGIPVINSAPAGRVIDYDHAHYDEARTAHEYLPRGGIEDELAFAVSVVGDSMEPAIRDGDRVIVGPVFGPGDERARYRLTDGDCVFVRVGPDSKAPGVSLGRYYARGEKVEIRKDNKKYKPITVDRGHITQLGLVLEMRRVRP
jgi:phage repressor protein C with HTH and peptisase S24 domain